MSFKPWPYVHTEGLRTRPPRVCRALYGILQSKGHSSASGAGGRQPSATAFPTSRVRRLRRTGVTWLIRVHITHWEGSCASGSFINHFLITRKSDFTKTTRGRCRSVCSRCSRAGPAGTPNRSRVPPAGLGHRRWPIHMLQERTGKQATLRLPSVISPSVGRDQGHVLEV